MTLLEKELLTRAKHSLLIEKSLITRASNTFLEKSLLTRAKHSLLLEKNLLTRARAYPRNTLEMLQQISPSSYSTGQAVTFSFGCEILIKNLQAETSKKIPGYLIDDIQIQRGRNQATEWRIILNDNHNRLFSTKNTSSEYYGWMGNDVYSSKYNLKRSWHAKIKIGGETWWSPLLIPIHIRRISSIDGYKTEISGTDLSRNLLIENQTLESWQSTSSDRKTFKGVAGEILEYFGISKYDFSRMDDYPVRQIHFQGESPMDIINRGLEVPNAFWFFDRDVFTISQPAMKKSGYDWKFVDRKNIEELEYDDSNAELVNQITVCRSQTSGGVIEQEGEGVGWQSVSLSPPRFGTSLQVLESRWCFVNVGDFPVQWINEAGKINGTPPYTEVRFVVQQQERNYDEAPISAGTTVYWKVRITGQTLEEIADGIGFDSQFSVTVNDKDSQKSNGIYPAPVSQDNTFIPNSEWAEEYGRRFLDEKKRLQNTASLRIPYLFPWINPGDTILVTDYGSDLTKEYFFVETTSLSVKTGETNITGSQYP